MIYYEPNEDLPQSKLPKSVIEYGNCFGGLEQMTGADFIIVPEIGNYEKITRMQQEGKNLVEISKELEMSLTDVVKISTSGEDEIIKHILSGALLVQRKSGYDFVQSIGSRVNDAIARMCEISHHQYQRVILVTGSFSKQDGFLVLNSKITNWTWESFIGSVTAIKYKGATVEFLPDDSCILDWIKLQESQLIKYKHEDTKWIVPQVYFPPDMPDIDDPLQLMRPVRDCRLSMIHIPGWGIDKVNALYQYVMKALNLTVGPTLMQMIHYATSWETADHVKGVGKTLIKNARSYVGLKEGEYICVNQNNVTVQR